MLISFLGWFFSVGLLTMSQLKVTGLSIFIEDVVLNEDFTAVCGYFYSLPETVNGAI